MAVELPTLSLPPGDVGLLVMGAALAVAGIVLVVVLKRIMENLIVGLVGFLALKIFFGVNIPLLPGIIISILFGLSGLGALLILHFFGVL